MVPCAILGDSLAAGVALFRPDCLTETKAGISSAAYLRAHTTAIDAVTVLISLGVNDGDSDPATVNHLVASACTSTRGKSSGSCRLVPSPFGKSSAKSPMPSETG